MSTDIVISLNPYDILGVSREATLQEIRDAYRVKVKRYHPDTGGEDWAFRVVSRAYETLTTSRVARAAERESSKAPPPPPPPASRPEPTRPAASSRPWRAPSKEDFRESFEGADWLREGSSPTAVNPNLMVDVEKMTVLHEADAMWMAGDGESAQRLVSCSYSLNWPSDGYNGPPDAIPGAAGILDSLKKAFDDLCRSSGPLAASSSVINGRFAGWASYPDEEKAAAAAVQIRKLLSGAGLAMKRSSRDMIIPRSGR